MQFPFLHNNSGLAYIELIWSLIVLFIHNSYFAFPATFYLRKLLKNPPVIILTFNLYFKDIRYSEQCFLQFWSSQNCQEHLFGQLFWFHIINFRREFIYTHLGHSDYCEFQDFYLFILMFLLVFLCWFCYFL